jgi:hypothetical protein
MAIESSVTGASAPVLSNTASTIVPGPDTGMIWDWITGWGKPSTQAVAPPAVQVAGSHVHGSRQTLPAQVVIVRTIKRIVRHAQDEARRKTEVEKRYLALQERVKRDFVNWDRFTPENAIGYNQAVTRAYAALYRMNRKFIWAGLAVFGALSAGEAIFSTKKAFDRLHDTGLFKTASDYQRLALGGMAAAYGLSVRDEVMALVHVRFAEGNLAIAKSLFWQHLAYMDGGLASIKEFHREGYIPDQLMEAWTNLDSNDTDRQISAARSMVDYEQRVILQESTFQYLKPVFTGVIGAIQGISDPITNPLYKYGIKMGQALDQPFSGTDYSDPNQRMAWINGIVIQTWGNAIRDAYEGSPRDYRLIDNAIRLAEKRSAELSK